jgi:hypothetical protein
MITRQANPRDPSSFKELSDNRDRYILQSERTKYGRAAELPTRDEAAKARKERTQ